MKWTILFTSLFLIQTQAQDISLFIIEKSIQAKDDTLYLRFKVQNTSVYTIVFYNLNNADIGASIFTDTILKSKKTRPRLLIDVFINNNKLPNKIRGRTGELKNYSNYLAVIDKFHVIQPNEIKEYNIVLDLWPINLSEGEYEFQLRYFSNNYYKKSLKEAKKTNPDLKNSVLFKGILRSNVCSLSINE